MLLQRKKRKLLRIQRKKAKKAKDKIKKQNNKSDQGEAESIRVISDLDIDGKDTSNIDGYDNVYHAPTLEDACKKAGISAFNPTPVYGDGSEPKSADWYALNGNTVEALYLYENEVSLCSHHIYLLLMPCPYNSPVSYKNHL